ncbi:MULTISPECIES: endonuclease/exonuclease/phosphatase family protein [Clostridium]|uniref:Endonuclease/exonuclease/phosphatase family protein n=1 Tax=Clostridium frigoriphilum TaxID=443253 RepID=A0ABU7UJF7_9CLOT|nr:endonuclease/exonuclease/phosphatase family protein [Clostridium sp. DSM 17811]MBU3098073.1 endonuclease/exonuclease/phosphatase family protein [Clostridium sp. DSM 17811]
MRILSLNVNNFGGIEEKPRYDEYKDDYLKLDSFRNDSKRIPVANNIVERIGTYQPDIIIMHEFDMNSPAGNYVITELENLSYYEVYPDNKEKNDYKKKRASSITLIFVMEKGKKSNNSPTNLEKKLRWNHIIYLDYVIIGIHVPYDIHFWNEMIIFYETNKNKKLIYIGDMNVYDPKTDRRERFDNLLRCGATDAWVERRYPNDTPTFSGATRIDYALMSPSAIKCLNGINIDSVFRERNLSDHSAVIVDMI